MSKTGRGGTHITVEVVHPDTTFTVIGDAFQELGAAAFFALRLADDLGRTMTPYSDGPSFPRSVVIRRGNVIEWEILVF